MYHTHFGLREEPFGVTPDRRFFYETAQHREAVATLFYAIQQRRGFALLLGRAGLGKTSILFTLAQMLSGKAQIAYLASPYYDRETVLESILASLGLEAAGSPVANHKLFYQYLLKTHSEGKTVVVVFDEAQDLNRDILEAIRMLSNLETPTGKLLQIVLAGQPRLAKTLKQPDCEQIRQRFSAIVRLDLLSSREVHDYMTLRLQTAGGSIALFTPAAIDTIASASGGIPRNVNTICFNSLTLAYALDKRRVGVEEVAEVLHDLDLPAGDTAPMASLHITTDRPATVNPATGPAPLAQPATVRIVAGWRLPVRRVTARAVPESLPSGNLLAFAQSTPSFRPVWIAVCLTLVTACTFLFSRF